MWLRPGFALVLAAAVVAPCASHAARCPDTSGFADARESLDAAVPCDGKRGPYLKTAKKAVKGMGLSKACQRLFLKLDVVQSTCGRSGAICCQAKAGVAGRFVRKASQCKAPGKICTGGASVGAACTPTGECATTTTITTPTLPTTTTSTPTSATTTTTLAPPGAPTRIAVVGVAGPDPVLPGTHVGYHIVVTNTGDAPATGVKLRMPIANGSDSSGCRMDGGRLVEGSYCYPGTVYEWAVGFLAPGASATVRPVVLVSQNGAPPTFATSVRASADNAPQAGPIDITTAVDAVAPLQVALHGGPDAAAPGEVVEYALTFGNRGEAPRLNAALTATLPAGVALDALSLGDGGTAANGVITWDVGTLSPGATGQRTFRATVTDLGAGDPRTRRVTARLVDGGVPQASARAATVTAVETPPALGITLTASPDPVQRGTGVTYRVTVSNLGDATRTGVTARLRLPTGSPSSGCRMDGGGLVEGSYCYPGTVYQWAIGTLPGHQSVTVEPFVDTATTLPGGFLLTTLRGSATTRAAARAPA